MNQQEFEEKVKVDANKNGIPDIFERQGVPPNMKLKDDPRYQAANLWGKFMMHLIGVWGVDFTKIKDTRQLRAEGIMPQQPAGRGGRCAGIAILVIMLFSFALFIGIFIFMGYILIQNQYG